MTNTIKFGIATQMGVAYVVF